MITCRINNPDQARVAAIIRREPTIQSLLSMTAAAVEDVWGD